MSLIAAYFLPHPPLIFNEIGKGREEEISDTIAAYNSVSEEIAKLAPETLIIVSPHTVIYSDYFHISPGRGAHGNFGAYGARNLKAQVAYDVDLVKRISEEAEFLGIPAGIEGQRDPNLDHASLVALKFIQNAYEDFKVVRIGFSGLSFSNHYKFGIAIAEACEYLGRKTVLIASGDLSHKLRADGPYGFSSAGPEFDEKMAKIMVSGDFLQLLETDRDLTEEAAECGFRSFLILAGALDGFKINSKLLSYEGPFGVGYAVASFHPMGVDKNRKFLNIYLERREAELRKIKDKEDVFVSLARVSVEHFIQNNKVMDLPLNLPFELIQNRAGVFVTLKKEGQLRGCIGTISPTQSNIAEEIVKNAVSAATQDYRFDRVEIDELKLLEYSVDVLGPPEPIESFEELNPEKYGVIVSKGNKRGLLLPDLSGIDSAEEQVGIALQKAGITENEKYILERFEVVRHK